MFRGSARFAGKFRRSNFARVFGPAWLVMMADVDAACVIGGAQTGAVYGYGFIWLFIVLIIPLYIVQELAGRISVVTGKGLGSVIREHYSGRLSFLLTAPMALSDVVTYGIEYIGIAVGLQIMGLSLYYTVPAIYVLHILLVTKRRYIQAEKPLIIISAFLMGAFTLTLILRGIQPFSSPLSNPVLIDPGKTFFFLVAANVGAVVMPFMIFFQASATGIKTTELKEKGLEIGKRQSLRILRKETVIGAVVTELLMIVIEMTFAGIPQASTATVFASANELGRVLTPVAGPYSLFVFGIGLIAAAFIALIVISLASAWGIAESLGIRQRSVWLVYVAESLPAIAAVLFMPSGMLVNAVLYMLVFFVFVLVGPMAILGIIGKNKGIMGEFALSRRESAVYWTTFCVVISTALLAVLV